MEFTGTYSRKPFVVEAIQITEENIDELAALPLGEVKEKDGSKFIALDKRIVPNIHRAFVGWWVTRMDDNLRCYSPKIFEEQFEEASEDVKYDLIVAEGSALPEINPSNHTHTLTVVPNGNAFNFNH